MKSISRILLVTFLMIVIGAGLFALSSCDDFLESTLPHEHVWGEWNIVEESTCAEEGIIELCCSICGHVESMEYAKKEHVAGDWTLSPEATCTKPGLRVIKCINCDQVMKAETIPAKGHAMSDWIIDTELTCTENGEMHRSCSTCGEVEEKISHTKGHSVTDWTITSEPTCTEDGEERGTCSTCQETIVKSIPQTGHSESEWIIDSYPTCTEDGKRYTSCTVCGVMIKEENLKSGHQYVDGKCIICGYGINSEGVKIEFDFGEKGEEKHVDPWLLDEDAVFVSNNYTLKFTDTYKIFGIAYDAKGNSCIKIGTGSDIGSLTFEVPNEVTAVIIRIAKYKVKDSDVVINGIPCSLTKNSNDGEYNEFIIDTSKTKTVTITTVAKNYRAMIDSITYIIGSDSSECDHKIETIPSVSATCTTTGLTEGKKCSVCGEVLVAQEVVPVVSHNYVDGKCVLCGYEVVVYDITLLVPYEDMKAHIEGMIEEYMSENPGIIFNYTVNYVPDSTYRIDEICNPSSNVDLHYEFFDNTIIKIIKSGALMPLSSNASDIVKSTNSAASLRALTLDGTVYAYPLTEHNGYYLYYDKSIITNPQSLEQIIADCEAAKKNFNFELSNPWYMTSFFHGTGCYSRWSLDENGQFVGVDDTYNSPEGLIALKGLQKVLSSSYHRNQPFVDLNAAAIVTGIWSAQNAEDCFGEDLGIAKLPSFTVDSSTYQLGSYMSGMYLGIKPQSDPDKAKALELLALYLSGEKCQLENYEKFGNTFAPTNLDAQKSDAIKSNPHLTALYEQNKYSLPFVDVHSDWWDIANDLEYKTLVAESENELKSILDNYDKSIDEIMTPAQEKPWCLSGFFNNEYTDYPMTYIGNNTWTSDTIYMRKGDAFLIKGGNLVSIIFGADGKRNWWVDIVIEESETYQIIFVWDGVSQDAVITLKKVHTHTEEILPAVGATCTTTGLTEGKKCSDCGEILVAQEVVPTGHNYVNGNCEMCGVTSEEYFEFTLLADGTYSIKAKNVENMPSKVVIPSIYNEKTVTKIADYAFNNCWNITNLIMPDSIVSIGERAFNSCWYMTEVTMSQNISFLGEGAFYNCSNLLEIEIPRGITHISTRAFVGCASLTSLKIPDNITSIGDYAFPGCAGLTNITIPDSVTSIGREAFACCYGLTDLVIGDNVSTVGRAAFYYCTILENVVIGNSVTFIDDDAFYGCSKLANVYYKGNEDSWNSIDIKNANGEDYYLIDNNFYYYSETEPTTEGNFWHWVDGEVVVWEPYVAPEVTEELAYTLSNDGSYYIITGIGTFSGTELVIPSTYKGLPVREIAKYAFLNSTIESVVIPDNITKLNWESFSNCSSLMYVDIGNGIEDIVAYAFYNCPKLETVVIGTNVKQIETYAFVFCDSMQKVYISSLDKFCEANFYGAGNFYWNNASLYINGELMTDIVIPDGTTCIGNIFYEIKINSVVIPASVTCFNKTPMGSISFTDTTVVYYKGSESDWMSSGINNTGSELTNRYYYSETEPTTEGNFWHWVDGEPTVWEVHVHTEEIFPAVAPTCTTTGLTEGKKCSECGEILVAQTVVNALGHTEVVDAAVAPDCVNTGLTEGKHCSVCNEVLVVQEVVPAGHNYVNGNCSACGVTSEEYFIFTLLDDGTYSIKAKDVNNMPSKVVIPNTYNEKFVTNISYEAFAYCTRITNVIISDSVTCIDRSAFYGCSYLTSVVIPNSITYIGSSAFDCCVDLDNVIIPNSVTYIGSGAFFCCYSLTNVVIGNSVDFIGDYAFSDCQILSSITVDENNLKYKSVNGNLYSKDGKTLIRYAIGKKDSTFEIPDSVTSIGNDAFAYCNNLTSIVIGGNVTSIGTFAFWNCFRLTSVTIGDSVTSIGDCAFSQCYRLTSVVLGNSVTSIGSYAFDYCDTLAEVYYNGNAEEWANVSIGFDNAPIENATIYYYSETQPTTEGNFWHWVDGEPVAWDTYDLNEHVHTFQLSEMILTPSCISAGYMVVSCDCGASKIQMIPATSPTLTHSPSDYCCGFIDELPPDPSTYSQGLVFVSNNDGSCYVYASSLCTDENVIIPGISPTGELVARIRPLGFSGCKLKSVTISFGTSIIGVSAFSGCSTLETVILPSTISRIEDDAFANCTSLTYVFYNGSKLDWERIEYNNRNTNVDSIPVYYYSYTAPTEEGNFWHWVNGEPVAW